MDIGFLQDYIVLVMLGICLCLGYVIKTSFDKVDNKYIPLIMAITGVLLSLWLNGSLTPETLLQGLASGLASTGAHQLVSQIEDDE